MMNGKEKGSIINKDELRDAARQNFVEVLKANGISILKQSGNRGEILCPHHNDTRPGNCYANLEGRYAGSIKCFACGYSADAYKLTADMHFNGVANDVEVWKTLAPYIGVPVEYENGAKSSIKRKKKPKISEKQRLENLYNKEDDLSIYTWKDYTAYYKECNQKISSATAAIQYLKKRGITEETIKRFRLGYDNSFVMSEKYTNHAPRIIIPITKSYYLGRDIRPNLSEKEKRFSKLKPKGAYAALFNPAALKGSKPVFIVEGEFDAISIMQCGYQALALGGLGNYTSLIKLMLKNKDNLPPIILALDADERGQEATKKIKKELEALELVVFGRNAFYCNLDTETHRDYLWGDCKDANEALVKDEALLKRKLDFVEQRAKEASRKSA